MTEEQVYDELLRLSDHSQHWRFNYSSAGYINVHLGARLTVGFWADDDWSGEVKEITDNGPEYLFKYGLLVERGASPVEVAATILMSLGIAPNRSIV